jgi:hypothetical protein
MYRNHWVTSDVQFRKVALLPPSQLGLGWAKIWFILILFSMVGLPHKKFKGQEW